MGDDSQIKNDFVNEIVITMYADIGEEHANKLKNVLYMNLTKYAMSEKTTEISIYEGDKTERILRNFLISKKIKGCTDRTIEYYGECVKKAFEIMKKTPLDVTSDDIRLYMVKRQLEDKVSNVTVNNERRALSSLFDWMQKEEIRLKNPMIKIDAVKEIKKRKHAFTEYEIEIMRTSLKNTKDKAIFEVLVSSWARVSEVAQIRLDELEGDKVTVHGKGQKERIVYLNARAIVAIQNYMKDRKDDNPFLFPKRLSITGDKRGNPAEWYKNPEYVDKEEHIGAGTIEHMVRMLGRKNGIQAHPHKFRRTGATMALQAGMPIEQVSRILGHESIDTTQIYLDIKDKDVKNAFEKYAR